MGFTSLTVQTLLIREFLVTFYGNELIIGLLLANWLILEGLGSSVFARWAGRVKKPLIFYLLFQILISLYFPLSVFLTRVVKNFFHTTPGEVIGIIPIFLSSFLILLPLSFSDGAQFPFGCRMYSDFTKKPLESIGKVYILEALGFIIAGPVFTYLFIIHYHSFQVALIIALLNLISGLYLITAEKKSLEKKIFIFLLVCLVSLNLYFLIFNFAQRLHSSSIAGQWQGRKVLSYRNSIYGNLSVSGAGEQYTFYSDGIPVITTPYPDISGIEEFVHFALLSHQEPHEVLLIGGGAGGVIAEILKQPVRKIDYTELDPLIIKMVKEYSTPLTLEELDNPRVEIKYVDGRKYVRDALSNYDFVLVNLPSPSTLRLNRFYTVEFFKQVRKILKPGGILVFPLPGSLSYISPELRNLNGSIAESLKIVYPYVKIIPGDTNLYFASLSPLKINPEILKKRLNERKIKSKLLTPFYLEYRLHQRWFDWYEKSMGEMSGIKKNYDLSPAGLFYELTYWGALFTPQLRNFLKFIEKINLKILTTLIILFSLSYLAFRKVIPQLKRIVVPYTVFTTGFLGITGDLVFVFVYQSFYGYVYHHLALLVTAFMAGLTVGGWLMTRRLTRLKDDLVSLLKFEFALIIFSLSLIPLFIFLNHLQLAQFTKILSFLFFLLAGISGFLVGSEFPLANKIYSQTKEFSRTAGILYAADLFGAWIGALAVSVCLVPVIGVINTCLILALLKTSSLAFLFTAGL